MRGHTVFGEVFAGVRANEVERERSWAGGVGVAGSVENPVGQLAERLRRLRAEHEMSMDALRARSGLGRTTVSQALNGRAVPSQGTVVALAKALRADPEPLLDLLAQGLAPADLSGPSAQAGGLLARSPADLRFDERYLAYVASRHANLTVFGLDLRRTQQARWPLDAAYLSLELAARKERRPNRDQGDEDVEHAPSITTERAERALSGFTRVVLRGHAGSGKTTLLQWLAVSAACGKVPDELSSWSARVPFLLPLRTLLRHGPLPSPAGFLKAVECPLVDAQPAGWVDEVLASGRGAILVDGVDEVPQEQRGAAEQWLESLVAAYPAAVFVVTTRPSAVPEGWLRSSGFTELTVLRMSTADTALFVGRWHAAARLGTENAAEGRELDDLAAALRVSIRAQRDLARLATSPLMCAVICALHRDRRGYLPHTRMELYAAALSMLLVRRDRERGVGTPESVLLSEQQSVLLLQRLAYWLIRNRQQEMDTVTALAIIADALPAMPSVAEQGDAGRVLEHLVARSGLLRRPTENTVDFIHRTFQDYLGAKAAVEARDFPLLVDKARDDHWEDVIRMAVAHACPAEGAHLLQRLVERGDHEEAYRSRTYLLAAAALRHAIEIDPKTRDLVDARTAILMPPRTRDDAAALAALGPAVLDLLPTSDRDLSHGECEAVIETAGLVGGDQALMFLQGFVTGSKNQYGSELIWQWARFAADDYAREILTFCPDVVLPVTRQAERRALRLLLPVTGVSFRANFTPDEITEYLSVEHTRIIRIIDGRSLDDLTFLRKLTGMIQLQLCHCRRLRNLDDLAGMKLHQISLHKFSTEFSFSSLASLPALRRLGLYTPLPWDDLTQVPAPQELNALWLGADIDCSIIGISRWHRLRRIALNTEIRSQEWRELAKLPMLKELSIRSAIEEAAPFPKITQLRATGGTVALNLDLIPEIFPNLEDLTLFGSDWVPDIAPLSVLEGLRVNTENVADVKGGHLFDPKLLSRPPLLRITG